MATFINPPQFTYGKQKVFNLQYDCDFCSHKFSSRASKNEHLSKHFDKKSCLDCGKSLIRIGDEWYELHLAINCTKIKCEPNYVNIIEESWVEEGLVKIEQHDRDAEEEIQSQNEVGHFNRDAIDEINSENELKENSNDLQEGISVNEKRDSDLIESDKISNIGQTTDKQEKNNNKKSFKCPILGCNKLLVEKRSLEAHISKHTDTKKYECNLCGKKYSYASTLLTHKKFHKDNNFKCRYCNRIFKSDEYLIAHLSVHEGEELSVYDIDPQEDINADEKEGDFIASNKIANIKQTAEEQEKSNDEKQLKCPIFGCNKILGEKRSLDAHINKHTGTKKYECEVCGKKYSYASSLRFHKRTHRINKMRVHKCTHCKRIFKTNDDLITHSSVHSGQELSVCDICQGTFSSPYNLKVHMNVHMEKTFKCTFAGCDRAFAIKKTLDNHINVLHDGIKNYVCDICGRKFSYSTSLRNHKKKHHKIFKFKCIYCPESFENDYLLSDHILVQHIFDAFTCDICNARFKRRYILRQHMETHTGKRFICSFEGCGKKYTQERTLNDHATIHYGVKKYICEVCGKHCLHRSTLNIHRKSHQNVPSVKYRCSFENCNKIYLSKPNLKEHQLEHDSNAARFQCETCEKSFLSKFKLKAHQIIHSDERKFKCRYCAATFKIKSSLQKHENIHTKAQQYECHECGKTFLQKGVLIFHQRIHTGEKYKCTVENCVRDYANPIDLKRHQYTVHGIFTIKHSCAICQEGFPEQKYLTKHMKIHNSN